MTEVEPAALDLAVQFEGFRAEPYLDPAGVPTQGYGSIWRNGYSTTAVTLNDPPIDERTARSWLAAEMENSAAVVNASVQVVLTPGQRAALQDFVYNLGAGAFRSSTLLRKLNMGDYDGAADELLRWDMAGGRVLAGLLRRRQAERALFVADPAP